MKMFNDKPLLIYVPRSLLSCCTVVVGSSRPVYYSILKSLGQRSQYISIKFPRVWKPLGMLLTKTCSCSWIYGTWISNPHRYFTKYQSFTRTTNWKKISWNLIKNVCNLRKLFISLCLCTFAVCQQIWFWASFGLIKQFRMLPRSVLEMRIMLKADKINTKNLLDYQFY